MGQKQNALSPPNGQVIKFVLMVPECYNLQLSIFTSTQIINV